MLTQTIPAVVAMICARADNFGTVSDVSSAVETDMLLLLIGYGIILFLELLPHLVVPLCLFLLL